MLLSAACGFGYLAFAGLCARPQESDQRLIRAPSRRSCRNFLPKAKRVIFLFMQGAPSHVDTFDYKPKLTADDGQAGHCAGTLMGRQWKFQQHGKSGLYISELFPTFAQHADDMCIINGMYTDNPAHPQATIQMHTGTARFVRPSMGAVGALRPWHRQPEPARLHHHQSSAGRGRGAELRQRLPARRLRRNPRRRRRLALIPNVTTVFPLRCSAGRLDLIQSMNHDMLTRSGDNAQIEGVIASYELGFRMQTTVPTVMDTDKESQSTLEMYGIGRENRPTPSAASACWLAVRRSRRAVHRSRPHRMGPAQSASRETCRQCTGSTDQPIAALLTDLKQRDMLEDTLVIWGGEFGRTPFAQNRDGRDHNNRGFSMWMAGGGAKGGINYGATDDYGYSAVTNPVHIHDLHATILAHAGPRS